MNSDIEPADTFTVDKRVADASQADYDGLILPGGTVNADKLRASERRRRLPAGVLRDRQAGRSRSATAPGRWSRPISSAAAR